MTVRGQKTGNSTLFFLEIPRRAAEAGDSDFRASCFCSSGAGGGDEEKQAARALPPRAGKDRATYSAPPEKSRTFRLAGQGRGPRPRSNQGVLLDAHSSSAFPPPPTPAPRAPRGSPIRKWAPAACEALRSAASGHEETARAASASWNCKPPSMPANSGLSAVRRGQQETVEVQHFGSCGTANPAPISSEPLSRSTARMLTGDIEVEPRRA